MGFMPRRFYSGNPEACFVGEAKRDGQNAYQRCQFVGVGHMCIFQPKASCFQAGEQRFNAPTVAVKPMRTGLSIGWVIPGLCRKLTPFGQRGSAIFFEGFAAVEMTFEIEMIVDRSMN